MPSVEPLSTTIVSWPRTLSRHLSSHGIALKVTTIAETPAAMAAYPVLRRRSGRAAPRIPSQQQDPEPGQRQRDRDEEEQEAGGEGGVGVDAERPRKLTKKASRTAIPLIVNGKSRTRKSSGPMT